MRIVSVSDIHTVHRRTPTTHILRNLSRLFYTDVDLDNTDLVLVTGDVFDRFVDNTNADFLATLEWFKAFFVVCKAKNVKVRFTEGTSLHDWEQIRHIMLTVEQDTDVAYFNEIAIETFPTLDNLTVMYVPDNMSSKTPDDIWALALACLAKHGMDKVDLIALHGGFYYQLPEKGRKHAHMETRWSTIVRYGIFSGHIHTPSTWNNIIFSNGSFDRISHGEEHAKGCWLIDLDLNAKVMTPTFWENTLALPYTTIKVGLNDLAESIVLKVKKLIQSKPYPPASHFRIQGGHHSVVKPIISSLAEEYPQFGFKDDSENDEVQVEDDLFDTKEYEGIALTKDNLFGYVKDSVMAKFEGTDITEDEVHNVLKEFL